MEPDELLARVRALRGRGFAPSEVARALGLRKSEAARLVRIAACAGTHVREAACTDGAAGPDGALHGEGFRCWVSPGWRNGLTVDGHPEWPNGGRARGAAAQGGLVCVLTAASQSRARQSVCGYLVDTWCMGVKDALGPRRMDEHELDAFRRAYFAMWHSDGIPAPPALAQHLVLGAVDYAHGLGLEPCRDFRRARRALEPWQDPSAITFGRNGMPYYIAGSYEQPRRVVETLERTVGRGAFHFIIPVDEFVGDDGYLYTASIADAYDLDDAA